MYRKSCITWKQTRIFVIPIFLAFMLAALTSSVSAEEKPAENAWEFSVTPYLWAISLSGDVTVKGLEVDVDLSFRDIWDELNIGIMVEYEARKGKWGFWGNTVYSNLGDNNVSGPRGLTDIDPTIKTLWQGLGGFYRLGTWDLADVPGKKTPSVTVDTYFGIRYTHLDIKIDFDGILRGRLNHVSKNKDWVEPLIGARSIWVLSDRWIATLAGDIGGFGAGSDFAWSAVGLIGYRFDLFGNDNARVLVGYRALSQDYTDGSGDNKFKWDVTLYGPILGLLIPF